MIEVDGLTKRYGDKLAVDGLTFTVEPGTVTGFLGPNGAGKSTTMRMIAGLDRPTHGTDRVNGLEYGSSPVPLAELGIVLEARAVHTGQSARSHLLALAQTAGLGRVRVDEVIELVGLTDVAGKRVGGFSLGMGQRLEQGGPELWDRFMDELREQQLGIPRPPGTPSVFAELQAAYEAAVKQAGQTTRTSQGSRRDVA